MTAQTKLFGMLRGLHRMAHWGSYASARRREDPQTTRSAKGALWPTARRSSGSTRQLWLEHRRQQQQGRNNDNSDSKRFLLVACLILLLAGCANNPRAVWFTNPPKDWTPPEAYAHCKKQAGLMLENGQRVVQMVCPAEGELEWIVLIDVKTKQVVRKDRM